LDRVLEGKEGNVVLAARTEVPPHADARPRVCLVGGPDIDARIDLMRQLRSDFDVFALGTSDRLVAVFAEAGFSYHRYPMSRGVNPLRDVWAFARLVRLFRRERPTIVHTFDTKPGVWGRLAARIAGVPIVIGTLPGLGSLYSSSSSVAKVIRLVYEPLQGLASRHADLTVFQNAQDAADFVERGVVAPDRATVIAGSGVRTDVFTPAARDAAPESRSKLGLAPDALVVTMISRVTRTKGVLDFAAAATRIRATRPEIEFVLAGAADGESFDALTDRELDELDRSLRWIGFRDDVREILGFTDVFVFPSYYREGIPRVLMEAASMGLPLIAADAPGSTEVVEDGRNGFLVPPRDVEAITDAVLRLADDPELRSRLGEQSRALVMSRHDLGLIAEQTRARYRELLRAKRPHSVAA
jgi:glycosyltransferase involved in cell wall biosynthesis